MIESETIEFKAMFVNDLNKEVIATEHEKGRNKERLKSEIEKLKSEKKHLKDLLMNLKNGVISIDDIKKKNILKSTKENNEN